VVLSGALQLLPPLKLVADIAEILLKVALNTKIKSKSYHGKNKLCVDEITMIFLLF
jgi:hypothetical protein